MNVDSFVDREALRDDEEEPEDGGIGSRPANGAEHFHDSSEEEEDDDEEAADEVCNQASSPSGVAGLMRFFNEPWYQFFF